MKISIDAMGGDNAPLEIVKGVYEALETFDDLDIQLYGDEEKFASLVTHHERLMLYIQMKLLKGQMNPFVQFEEEKFFHG